MWTLRGRAELCIAGNETACEQSETRAEEPQAYVTKSLIARSEDKDRRGERRKGLPNLWTLRDSNPRPTQCK